MPSVIDVTPPASPTRRHHVGDLSKVARQMGGVPYVQSGSENTPTVIQGDHSPRPVDGLLTPTPHSTPWRNSLTSDRSVSPMSFSPPTPIQRTASTPIHEDDKYPASSLKSPANESEIHYTRPRTPFGEYLLSDEKQHAQPAEVSFRWLHDLGQDEEGVIVIVREAVTDIWSGEWNISLHDVISAIRFLYVPQQHSLQALSMASVRNVYNQNKKRLASLRR
ncbi:hypothetical protein BKA70DRAFT_708778 [Coprinopsis sp. MPI-PUGE-AT-0042]|nr:hypothetical protein BKA70DRAFT_708778 [Coprinopsis sp. MPI-PUGE-AT-0042]